MKRYLLVFLLFIVTGCSSQGSNQMTEEMPSDFDFVLNYGVTAVNKVDTFNDTYTKDLIPGTTTTSLVLSEAELKSIYYEMKKINILETKTLKPKLGKERCVTIPHDSFILKLQIEGEHKEITWDNENSCNLTKDQKELIELAQFIRAIVEEREEYKRLPAAKGGYE